MPPGVRRRAWIGPPVRERKTVHATTALPEPSETIAGCVVRTPSGVICRRGPTAVPSAPRRWTRRTPGPPPKPVGTFELTQARRTSPAFVAASRGAKARWSGSATCTGAPKPPPRGRIATWTALPEPLLSSHAATAVPVVLIATCGARTRPEADSTCGGPNSRPAGAWAAIARPEAESTQTTTVVPSASIATCGSAPTPGAGSANGAPKAVPASGAPACDVRRDQTSSRVPPGPATNDGEYADSVPSLVSACVRTVRPPAIVAACRRSARSSTRRQAVTRSAPLAGSPTATLSTKCDERSSTIEGPRNPLRVVPDRTSARLSPRIWRTKPIARRPRTSAATAGCDMRPVLPTACGVLHDAAVAEAGRAAAANAAAARGRASERLIAPPTARTLGWLRARSYNRSIHDPPARRRAPVLPRPRAAGARALARARRVPRVDPPPPGRAAVGVLRGPADRERPAGLAPRPVARLQGHLPALQDHARLLRRAQGRLGLPRPARRDRRRAAARHQEQGRDRGLRHRRVQREVPRVRVRVPRGLERADRAHRLLGRPRARLPHARPVVHRVRLVGAARDPRQGPALRGPQGRAVLPAVRHRPELARARARLRGRRRPEHLRPPAGRRGRRAAPARRRAARLDDDPVDAGLERGGRGRPRADVRAREGRPARAPGRARRGARRARARQWRQRRRRPGPRPLPGRRARRRALRAALPVPARLRLRRARPHRPPRRLRHRRRRHRPCPHGDRVRRGRLPPRRAVRPQRRQPRPARRHVRRAHRPVRRSLGQGRRPGPHRRPAPPRPAAPGGAVRARLSALLALRHAAALLRQALVVHRDDEAPRRPARRQRGRRLASRAHQARAHGRVAARQRRLGALARALLGHAAAGVALRRRARARDRLALGARVAERGAPGGPAPPVRRRGDVPVHRGRLPGDDGARPRGHRRLVRLGLDAVRAVARPARERGRLPRALPGRLHLRGARPDPRLVLLAARDQHPAVRS